MDEYPGAIDLLSSRVDELEKRVHALEHPDENRSLAVKAATVPASAASDSGADSFQTANVFPILGRAMLGIAGAYVLRAVAEAGAIPRVAVAAVATVYASAWLVWAARAQRSSEFAALVYTGTSSAILAPMLWEITLHFRVFTPGMAAGVLAAFATLATLISLRDGSRFAWIAQCSAAITAVALALGTHEVSPFVWSLLLAALVIEYSRTRGYAQPVWPFIALAIDGALWGMIFIYSGPQNARAEYPELSAAALVFPAVLLFTINTSSVAVRAILQLHTIRLFELAQVVIAFGLAISGVFFFAPEAVLSLGIACLILSAAAYVATFRYLRGYPEMRNFHVFSLWSAALLVAGVLWSLPKPSAGFALAIAGLVAYLAASQTDANILELHGATFLCTAVVASGVARYVFGALAASLAERPVLPVWIIACSAFAAYAVVRDSKADPWSRQVLHFVPALLAAAAVCALLIHGALTVITLATTQDAHHIAFLRTLVISAIALGLAFVGSRWGRVAMMRLAYVALAFVAAKLIFEDLRHGNMEFIAASIGLFAVALIAAPRLVRLGVRLREFEGEATAVEDRSLPPLAR